jgi:hypothetical protein
MSKSKHRRKGKLRPRGKVSISPRASIPPWASVDPEFDALLMARLRKMYGGTGWRDWTDAQIDVAFDEVDREETAAFLRRAAARARPVPEPQQLELFPLDD